MELGTVRATILKLTIIYEKVFNDEKKLAIAVDIGLLIKCIKQELGEFSVVADNCVSLESKELTESFERIKKHLQE